MRGLSILVALLMGTAGDVAAKRAYATCLYPEIQSYMKRSIDLYQGENPWRPIPLYVRVWDKQADIEDLAEQLRRLSAVSQSAWFVDSVKAVDDIRAVEEEFRGIERSAYIIVDGEFMLGDLPKYNSILVTYRDVVLDGPPDLKLIFDPYLDVVDKQTIFAQLVPGRNTTNLAYKIEGAALLMRFPGLLAAEGFTSYLGELPDKREVDKDRDQIISGCVEDFLSQRAEQK